MHLCAVVNPLLKGARSIAEWLKDLSDHSHERVYMQPCPDARVYDVGGSANTPCPHKVGRTRKINTQKTRVNDSLTASPAAQ